MVSFTLQSSVASSRKRQLRPDCLILLQGYPNGKRSNNTTAVVVRFGKPSSAWHRITGPKEVPNPAITLHSADRSIPRVFDTCGHAGFYLCTASRTRLRSLASLKPRRSPIQRLRPPRSSDRAPSAQKCQCRWRERSKFDAFDCESDLSQEDCKSSQVFAVKVQMFRIHIYFQAFKPTLPYPTHQ